MYHSTLSSRVIKKKKKKRDLQFERDRHPLQGLGFDRRTSFAGVFNPAPPTLHLEPHTPGALFFINRANEEEEKRPAI